MKTILSLLIAFLGYLQISEAVAARFFMGDSDAQPIPRVIACNAEFILPTDVFTITVENACLGVTYSLYKDDFDTPLISAKGYGRNLTFTGAWGAGCFKVLDGAGLEMNNKVDTHLYWPLTYTFSDAEMDPRTPVPADGGIANLDIYACWGPTIGGMQELFDRYNAGDSPTWDNRIMRIYAESQEMIDHGEHTVFHCKIFLAPALAPVKVESITGIRNSGAYSCYSIYQYPVPVGHLYDWDMHFDTDNSGNCIHLTNTQYLVNYELYNCGELIASQIQEPYKNLCFDRLGPGVYTVKASHQGFSKSHPDVFEAQLDKLIQQKPLITYDGEPTITLDKEGGNIVFTCNRDSIIHNATVEQVIQEFNSENPRMRMELDDVSRTTYRIALGYSANFLNKDLIVDSKFIFKGNSHIRFVQAGRGDLVMYDVLSRMIPKPFVGLSGSQLGVTYDVCEDGSPIGISLEGTGQAIEFSNVPVGGIYTVRATKSVQSTCENFAMHDMNGVAVLLRNPENTLTPCTNAIIAKTYYGEISSYADITYFDGLGAPYQTVLNRATPNGKNLVVPILYDEMYRDNATVLLPFPVDSYTGVQVSNPRQEQGRYYSQRKDGIQDNSPYSINLFDQSGLDRVRYSYQAGDIYRQCSKYKEYRYETNSVTDKIFDFRYNYEDQSISILGYVKSEMYAKNTVIDEDGNKMVQFADANGKTVLERSYISPNQFSDTYYIYDPCFSRLVWVISPEGSARLQPDFGLKWDDDISNMYCYRYCYDGRGNLIEKQLPGCGKEEFVYDKSGRLVYSTDANILAQNRWLYYAYDNHGNLLSQSSLVYNSTRQFLQSYYDRVDNLLPYLGQAGDLDFPRDFDSCFSSLLSRNLAHYVYGNIEYIKTSKGLIETERAAPEELAFQHVGFSEAPLANPRGLKTYEKLAVLGDDTEEVRYVERAFYYDYKKRIIQAVERNPEGGISRISYEYDILGNILKCQESRQASAGADEDMVFVEKTYDNRCRLIRENWVLNNSVTAEVEYTYDELGELIGKTMRNGLLNMTMAHNIQGWQTDMQVTDNGSFVFDMRLSYYDPQQRFSIPCYMGNISEWTWRNGEDAGENTYVFTYDSQSRLTDTRQYANSRETNQFVERNMSYDRNGNIKKLQRYEHGTLRKNYTYAYIGNRLKTISNTQVSSPWARSFANFGPVDSVAIIRPDPIDPTNPGLINPPIIRPVKPVDPIHPTRPIEPDFPGPGILVPPGTIDPTDPNPGVGIDPDKSTEPTNPEEPQTPEEPSEPEISQDDIFNETEYAYDLNGNMLYDPMEGLKIQYNHLNLTEKILRGDTIVAKYSYLSDGTKLSATDADGNGLYYLGSLVYNSQNGDLSLESAAFSNGRFIVTSSGVEPHYFVTDHLGSVRTVVNNNGEVIERNDYHPFGMRWHAGQLSENRYRYNGKETQGFVNVPYSDYGARMYNGEIGRWFTVDLLAENHYSISPYVLCNNNPIRFEDKDGRDWKDKVAGVVIGMLTNIIPSSSLRKSYTPNDAVDYNIALAVTDARALIAGNAMSEGGEVAVVAGAGITVAAGAATLATAGVAGEVTVPAMAAGKVITWSGAAAKVGGELLMFNAIKNAQNGYNYGITEKSSKSKAQSGTQYKRIGDSEIKAMKKKGFDPHDGTKPKQGGKAGKIDYYKDKAGNIYYKGEKGTHYEETGVNINDYE